MIRVTPGDPHSEAGNVSVEFSLLMGHDEALAIAALLEQIGYEAGSEMLDDLRKIAGSLFPPPNCEDAIVWKIGGREWHTAWGGWFGAKSRALELGGLWATNNWPDKRGRPERCARP